MVGLRILYISFIILPWTTISAIDYTNTAPGEITWTNIDEGYEQFPNSFQLQFSVEGEQVHLDLLLNEELTAILSPHVFENSHFLPSGLLTDDNKHEFAVYRPGAETDLIVVHRPSAEHRPRLYGRYTEGDIKKVVHSHEDDDLLLYVRPDVSRERIRSRRDVGDEERVLELFIIADKSVYDVALPLYWNDMASTKEYLKETMFYLTKELDTMFKVNTSTSDSSFRVHFQQYQVITDSTHQSWLDGILSGDDIGSGAATALQTYYQKLIDNFAFPTPDVLMQITRYTIETSKFTQNAGSICNSATVIVKIDYPQTSMAKGVGLGLDLTEDASNGCSDTDSYIMSTNEGPVTNSIYQGNRWRLSTCSASELETVFAGSSADCLLTEDSLFAFDDTDTRLGNYLSATEQCQFRFGSSSSTCADVECSGDTGMCSNSGACEPYVFGQNTTCGSVTNGDYRCSYGFCLFFGETTTTSSTTSTTASTTTTAAKTTDDDDGPGRQTTTTVAKTTTDDPDRRTSTTTESLSTTPQIDCGIVETGSVEFDLPGCGCCGGCGCDQSCTHCDPGIPSNTDTGEECIPDPNCCGSKVKVTTLFVPDGCPHDYVEGPRTIIMEKNGWENPDTEVAAEVYQDSFNKWQVQLTTVD